MVKTRILLADDHPIVLAGIGMLIGEAEDLVLVGEATSGPQALDMIVAEKPDIAIIDISLPHMNGIVLARHVAEACPSVGVIVLTLHEDRSYLAQALAAGARGYVLKKSTAECLLHAIRGVLVGGLYVDPAMAGHMLHSSRQRASQLGGVAGLTEREAEVLRFVATGLTTKEIAGRLGLGAKSVETYKARGAAKVGVKTRSEIVRYASAQGWLASV
jgi:DNA-binding NarL/FixJ family response regulator